MKQETSVLRIQQWLPPTLFLGLFVLVWELAIRLGGIGPYLLPSPWQVLLVFRDRASDLFSAAQITLFSAVIGFSLSAILGVVIAILFAEFRWMRVSCYPYAILLHTVPIVAISPLIITWFGYGSTSVIVITFIVSLFPVITSTTNGLLARQEELEELFRLYHATRWQTLWKRKFPAAIPHLVSGLQTASGLAIVGAIIGEFFAGHEVGRYGLGYYMFTAQGQFRIDILIAAIILSTLEGIALFGFVTWTGAWGLRRWMGEPE